MINTTIASVHPFFNKSLFTTLIVVYLTCLLYTSDAADEEDSVELGGSGLIKKKKKIEKKLEVDENRE